MKTKMKVVRLRKFEPKMTPSGYWDNGYYELSNNYVDIPQKLFKDAIIEGVILKTSYNMKAEAVKVTVGNTHWIVQHDPKIFG